ncbi:MAG: hypothetical protein IK118_05480 [Clostridia bacterium]|nr:hypothetical protein [Clostridia bacterium]
MEQNEKQRRLVGSVEIVGAAIVFVCIFVSWLDCRNHGLSGPLQFAIEIVFLAGFYGFGVVAGKHRDKRNRRSRLAVVMLAVLSLNALNYSAVRTEALLYDLDFEIQSAEHSELTQEDLDRYVCVSSFENLTNGLRLLPNEKRYIAEHADEFEKIVVRGTVKNPNRRSVSHIVNYYGRADQYTLAHGWQSFCPRRSVDMHLTVPAGETADYEFVIIAAKGTKDHLPDPAYIYSRFNVCGTFFGV